MGELALRQIQGGIETVRGTPVVATRNLYGIMTITRDQARRYADEARGIFVKHFRANPKLVDAGYKLDGDLTFEDLPYFAEMFMQGGIAPAPALAATGWLYTYAPDLSSDLIKSRTFVAGDDTVQWQGAFSVADTVDFTLDLNDAVKMSLGGFTRDWIPVTSSYLTTAFAGGFQALAARVVESIMGYQSRLFIDPAAGPIGTTQVTGKFIAGKWGIKLNNKRKPFGDGFSYSLNKLGRGLKDVSCQITFEALNQSEFAQHYLNLEQLVRVQLFGSPIAGTNFGTTNQVITAGTTYTAITTAALAQAIPGGVVIDIGGNAITVAPAGAAAAALSIPVISFVATVGVASGATIMARKTINFDFFGFWDNFVLGARDTNTTFQLNLVGVYDITAGFDHRVAVLNGLTAAQAIS
jgi:hypothetical protein